MGRFLVETGNVPELAITSPARRAEDTLRIAQLAGGWQCEVRRSEALYSGGALGVIGEVAAVKPLVETLLVVSHEPTCSETIAVLAGGFRVRFPTAAMACIELEEGSPSGLRAERVAHLACHAPVVGRRSSPLGRAVGQ